ncbi:MAG: NUDIX hydrolase [Syntrophobacteraceae bacterium]|nr:NUDIX hydrolase [Syntrophobacteraceae bacterium]
MEETIRTLGILKAKHFSASLDAVRLASGRVTERIRIDHPEAAAILAFPDRDHIMMVRQWRYAIGCETLEIPAGKVDPGETAQGCAGRELLEETGRSARRLIEIFNYYPAIGYANEIIRIFVASGLTAGAEGEDSDEISGVEIVELGEVHDMIMSGRICDGKTVIGLSIFRARLDRGEIPDTFFS